MSTSEPDGDTAFTLDLPDVTPAHPGPEPRRRARRVRVVAAAVLAAAAAGGWLAVSGERPLPALPDVAVDAVAEPAAAQVDPAGLPRGAPLIVPPPYLEVTGTEATLVAAPDRRVRLPVGRRPLVAHRVDGGVLVLDTGLGEDDVRAWLYPDGAAAVALTPPVRDTDDIQISPDRRRLAYLGLPEPQGGRVVTALRLEEPASTRVVARDGESLRWIGTGALLVGRADGLPALLDTGGRSRPVDLPDGVAVQDLSPVPGHRDLLLFDRSSTPDCLRLLDADLSLIRTITCGSFNSAGFIGPEPVVVITNSALDGDPALGAVDLRTGSIGWLPRWRGSVAGGFLTEGATIVLAVRPEQQGSAPIAVRCRMATRVCEQAADPAGLLTDDTGAVLPVQP